MGNRWENIITPVSCAYPIYGSVVYGSAYKFYLQMFEPIQNHALCLWFAAFSSLRLTHWCKWDASGIEVEKAQYCLKVSSDTSNLALSFIFNHCFSAFFQRYPSQICSLGFRVCSDLHAIHFAQKDILPVVTPSHPPWLFSKPILDLSLNMHAKSHTSPEICQSNFLVVCDELSDYHHIYTDPRASSGRGLFLAWFLAFFGIGACIRLNVLIAEKCIWVVWKLDSISVQTVYRWIICTIGFLMI